MSTPHKPSQQENEYFAREDTEKRRRKAVADAAAEQQRIAQPRAMACPRCAAAMVPVPDSVTHASICGACRGMFLDAADLKAADGREGYLTHLLRQLSSRAWR